MNELNVKVGDRVVCNRGGWNSVDTIEEVARITQTGRIKLKGLESINFNRFGRAMGSSTGYLRELTPELEQKIVKEQTIRKCNHKLRLLKKFDYTTAVKILDALEEMEALKNE